MEQIEEARQALRSKFERLDDKKTILKAPEIRALFDGIREVEPDKRGEYGKAVNALKQELQGWIDDAENKTQNSDSKL